MSTSRNCALVTLQQPVTNADELDMIGCNGAPRPRPVATGSRCMQIDDLRTEMFTYGTGVPVVFLHGWGLSPRSYHQSLIALAALGYRVTAPSLPGFGRSTPLPLRRQNVDGVAEHLINVLDALGHEGPVDVVAHSFGGGVAMRIAALRPDLVKSLTLVCPVGGAGEGAVPLAKMFAGVLMDARHRWIVRAVRDLGTAAVWNPASTIATAYSAWRADQMDDLATTSRNQTPVRFLFADNDDVVTPGGIPASAFAGVTCEITQGRHSWLITEPQRFARHVHGYLASSASNAA